MPSVASACLPRRTQDGPSAGITLAITLISVLTGRCVRSDTAMTGELTLRGLVLPVRAARVGGRRGEVLGGTCGRGAALC